MIMKKIITVGLLVGSTWLSSAAVIFNNFGPGDSFGPFGLLLQGEDVGTIANVDQAASFTVGANNYLLTSIELGLGVAEGKAGPLDVILAADAGGEPGAALETISLNLLSGEQVTFAAASGSTLLSANTTYWVIADAKGTLDGGWNRNNIGDLGVTAGRSAKTGTVDYGPWDVRDPDEDQFALRVSGRITGTDRVPDAGGTLALLATSMLGLFAFGRRLHRGILTWRRCS
jgi:hypothetical protein